jgi:O-glycosyl hydrolase
VIDGFGASDESLGASMSSAQQAFFFGTGTSATSFGQPLGLSIIRVGLTDGNQDPGDCTSVSTSCAGVYVGDMQAAIANGARVFSSPWFHRQPTRPTAAQFARLLEGVAHFQAEATGITLPGSRTSFKASRLKCRLPSRFKLSIQNEPDQCPSYDGALWSAANIDTFIKSNLAPTFSSAGISTPIFEPEGGNYPSTQSLGAACAGDSGCYSNVGGNQWHDYQASFSRFTVSPAPLPSGWTSGKKWWMTEVSCGVGYGASFCPGGFNTSMSNALNWAALIDQRMQDGANAWLFWQFVDYNGTASSQDDSLMANSAGGNIVPLRAFLLGQYSKLQMYLCRVTPSRIRCHRIALRHSSAAPQFRRPLRIFRVRWCNRKSNRHPH